MRELKKKFIETKTLLIVEKTKFKLKVDLCGIIGKSHNLFENHT
jgi:hypothetical protein